MAIRITTPEQEPTLAAPQSRLEKYLPLAAGVLGALAFSAGEAEAQTLTAKNPFDRAPTKQERELAKKSHATCGDPLNPTVAKVSVRINKKTGEYQFRADCKGENEGIRWGTRQHVTYWLEDGSIDYKIGARSDHTIDEWESPRIYAEYNKGKIWKNISGPMHGASSIGPEGSGPLHITDSATDAIEPSLAVGAEGRQVRLRAITPGVATINCRLGVIYDHMSLERAKENA